MCTFSNTRVPQREESSCLLMSYLWVCEFVYAENDHPLTDSWNSSGKFQYGLYGYTHAHPHSSRGVRPHIHIPQGGGGGGGMAWRNTTPLTCSLESKTGVFSKKDQWPYHMTVEEPSISAVCGRACGIFEKGDLKGTLEKQTGVTQGSQPSLSKDLLSPFSGFHWLNPCSQGHTWVFWNIWVLFHLSWDQPRVLAEALQPSLLLWFDALAVS